MRIIPYFMVLLMSCEAFSGAEPLATGISSPSPALILDNGKYIFPCAQPIARRPLNLTDVVNLALCRNPQTREAWTNSQVYAAQIGVSEAGYLPSLDFNASASRNLTGSASGTTQTGAGLNLSYLLYDFGSRSANLEAAQQLFKASSASQDSTVQAVFLAAVQAYYQVQSNIAALNAAVKSEHAARESLAAAQARLQTGSATPADKLQAQTAYSQAILNRIGVEGNLKNVQGALANVLGLDANMNISLVEGELSAVPDSFDADIAALIEQARQHRPDLQAAAAQVRAAQASAEAVRAADKPTITLGASASQNSYSGITSNNSSIGINLNIPIFSGYAPTYRIRAAESQVESRAAQLERLRLQVALEVWTAYQNLTTATQSMRTATDLLDSATQSEMVALGRYKAGVGNILDVLNAQSALAGARQQRIQSAFGWNISRAILAQSMGNLDANLLQTLTSDQPR